MNLFYSTQIEKDHIQLDAEESRHLAKVLRMQVGEPADVIDGKGNRYQCQVELLHPKKARLKILDQQVETIEYGIQLAVAPTKNLNRWEWFLEKATEIGIDRISPIISDHSERKVLKMERQQRILVAAMKQSYKAKMPQLDELQSYSTFLENAQSEEKWIAHCEEDQKRKNLTEGHKKNKKVCILIGPEGDFSPNEIEMAIAKGFSPISLGKSRLRTETAALVALHSIHLLNE